MKFYLSLSSLFSCCSLASAQLVAQSFSLAPSCSSHSVFDAIPVSSFEPSDAAWDAQGQLLYLIDDNGRLAAVPGHYVRSRYVDGVHREGSQMVMGAGKPGQDVKVWTVTNGADLEGCAVDHDFPELIYLGIEAPAEILAFNVTTGEIQQRFPVGDYFGGSYLEFTVNGRSLTKHKGKHTKNSNLNAGLESLAFYPSTKPDSPPRLLAGRQSDSMIFVFDLAADRRSISYVGSVKPPGPGRDLSSMSVFLGKVYLVFDKALEALSVPMEQFEAAIKPAPAPATASALSPETLHRDAGAAEMHMPDEKRDTTSHRDQQGGKTKPSAKGRRKSSGKTDEKGRSKSRGNAGRRGPARRKKNKWSVERFRLDARGQEGIAFAYSSFACALSARGCTEVDDTPVVFAIDPPKKPGNKKDVKVGSYSQLQQCWRV